MKNGAKPTKRGGVVHAEHDLYRPLKEWLEKRPNFEVGTVAVTAIDTSRMKLDGKWQNPDVAEISIEALPNLRTKRIVVSTWEIKRWRHWDRAAPFEAASHARFAHYSYVALERPTGHARSEDDADTFDAIKRECERLGVGLATINRASRGAALGFRVTRAADPNRADDTEVEEFLAALFKKNATAKAHFDAMLVKHWGV